MDCNINKSSSGKIAKFEVDGADLLSFLDCLSLLRNNIGLISFGAEDIFTLFEEGSTTFYTVTEKNITSAIQSLKLKIKNSEKVDYAFFILVCPNEQLNKTSLSEIHFSSSKCIPSHEFWFQVYPREQTTVIPPITLPDKNLSYDQNDIATFSTYTTVYLFTNKR